MLKSVSDNSVDMVLCDPPYGIDFQSCRIKDKQKRKKKIINDKKPFLDFIPELERVIKQDGSILIFTRWDVQQQVIDKMKQHNIPPRAVIIWDKVVHGMGDLKRAPGSRYESIICFTGKDFRFPQKRPVDILRVQRVYSHELMHPNEKPVKLLEELILQYTNSDAVILDACMGSGSTGVACINTKRDFIGMELDPEYFEIAKKRIKRAERKAV